MQFNFEKALFGALMGSPEATGHNRVEPFFSRLGREITKTACMQIPTAGVRVNPDTARYELLYNPEFMASLSITEMRAVWMHELYHLIFMHVTHRQPGEVVTKKWNVSTDLAINSFLTGLPEGCLYAGQEDTPWEYVPPKQSAEWYMKNISWPEDFDKDDGGGSAGRGDHSAWGGPDDPVLSEMASRAFKKNLKQAIQHASQDSNGWGSVAHGMRKTIMKSAETKVDWKSVLRYFVKTSQKAWKRSTMKRINRRYPYIHPGRTSSRTAKIAISIDQSGSVSDGMLSAFFAELNKLASLAEFTVVPFDCAVAEEKIFVWKKGQARPWERVLQGGTCFNAPTKWVNDNNFDGHIVLTDLCAPKPIRSRCQRMWMTTSNYAKSPYFQTNERIIAIDS
jgi:predicted metal-dependent peptidase